MAPAARTLRPPRAAALAGLIFSVLMGGIVITIRLAVPPYQTDTGLWMRDTSQLNAVRFAIHLAPFAGIAFLWFIGVVRNRLGELEDQFFATVFLGSGLLFVASLFAAAIIAGAVVDVVARGQGHLLSSDTYFLARQIVGAALNVFGIKMAAVFMMSVSTLILRTGILSRWVAFSGFVCAPILLLIITSWPWIALLFPLWMLVVSTNILIREFRMATPAVSTPVEA